MASKLPQQGTRVNLNGNGNGNGNVRSPIGATIPIDGPAALGKVPLQVPVSAPQPVPAHEHVQEQLGDANTSVFVASIIGVAPDGSQYGADFDVTFPAGTSIVSISVRPA